MENQIIDNAQALAEALILLGDMKRSALNLEREMDKLEFSLTPAEGWPGKNDGERKHAHQLTLNHNQAYVELDDAAYRVKQETLRLTAIIEALQAQQEGFKWAIRNETNITLGGADILEIAADNETAAGQEKISDNMDGPDDPASDIDAGPEMDYGDPDNVDLAEQGQFTVPVEWTEPSPADPSAPDDIPF
jgi:hypothetical protein